MNGCWKSVATAFTSSKEGNGGEWRVPYNSPVVGSIISDCMKHLCKGCYRVLAQVIFWSANERTTAYIMSQVATFIYMSVLTLLIIKLLSKLEDVARNSLDSVVSATLTPHSPPHPNSTSSTSSKRFKLDVAIKANMHKIHVAVQSTQGGTEYTSSTWLYRVHKLHVAVQSTQTPRGQPCIHHNSWNKVSLNVNRLTRKHSGILYNLPTLPNAISRAWLTIDGERERSK